MILKDGINELHGGRNMGINPIRIMGNWDEGYALDIHTIKVLL